MSEAVVPLPGLGCFDGKSIAGLAASMPHCKSSFEPMELMQEDLRAEKDRVQLLFELTTQVTPEIALAQYLRTAAAIIRRVIRCDVAAIHLPDCETDPLRFLTYHSSENAQHSEQDRAAFGCDYCNEDVLGAFQASSLKINSEETGCLLPLIRHNRTSGVLQLEWREERRFVPEETEFLSQIASQLAVAIENARAYAEIRQLKEQLFTEKLYVEDDLRSEMGFEHIIGRSAAIKSVLRNIETVAPTDSTVLIYGETGTGKELVARAIHDRSPRRSKSFVKLNCAAIPSGLVESELFGHERGAFTGALAQRVGRFELANYGTAFLDEIGEISLELQPKLLRVLQEREFERLGSSRTIKTDARLVAATNRNLMHCVEEGTFRADLFYRLNVFPIQVPPLRERPEDIPLLVRHFVEHYARRINRVIDTIPSNAMEVLVRYPWPGNIRQLQNLIERSVIMSRGPVLRVPVAHLHSDTVANPGAAHPRTLEEAEREHILSALKETKWVLAGPYGAAAHLGLNRSTLQFRMKKLGIVRPCLQ